MKILNCLPAAGARPIKYVLYLLAVWHHPNFADAPALDCKLVFGTKCVELSGAHVVRVAIVALPHTVVQIHVEDLWGKVRDGSGSPD